MTNKLPTSYYRQEDVLAVARDLLGKYVFTNIGGNITGGIIVETEAYRGPDDRGSHAYADKRTPRNEVMYCAGGVAYMYICYGIHDMLNIVTGVGNSSHAVLIRSIQPVDGIEVMRGRRSIFDNDKRLCQGPGALAKSLGLTKSHNGCDLQGDVLWLENRGVIFNNDQIAATPRVGMNFDGPYKLIPWRFHVKGNPYVSGPRS